MAAPRLVQLYPDGLAGFWQGEAEGGALVGCALCPDTASVAVDDFAAEGQAQSGSGDIPAVQFAEGLEQFWRFRAVEAQAVVPYAELPEVFPVPYC